MLVVGVDENGLGPRLGPLVATAVTLEVDAYDRARLRRVGQRLGVEDSKQSSGFGRMARAESVALALLERVGRKAPRDADELLGSLSLDDPLSLRAPCPKRSALQCWSQPLRLPAFGGELCEGQRILDRLEKNGVRFKLVRSVVTCAGTLNKEISRGVSKLVIDLGMFERLLIDARCTSGGEIYGICGMVGGMRRYAGYFRHFDRSEVQVLREERPACHYRVPGLGELAFEVDSDDRHLPVAAASMVGKYLRELLMERQNRFYLAHEPSLPRPSGYHDPVTARFVDGSARLRKRLAVVDRCFLRAR